MSNDIPPHEIVDQSGSSNGNNSTGMEESGCTGSFGALSEQKDFDSMSDEDVWKHAEKFANGLKAHSVGGENGRKILLAWEEAGSAPKSTMTKHPLKEEFPIIAFETQQWRTWVSERCTDFLQLWLDVIEMMN